MTYHSPPWIENKVKQYEKAVNSYIRTARTHKSKAICDKHYEIIRQIHNQLKDTGVVIILFKRMH